MLKAFRADAVPCLLGTAGRAHTGPALSLFLLLTVSAAIGQTQTASIQGTVLDAKTQKPVPAALVVASRLGTPPSAKSTKSGGDGSFQIQGLVEGKYSLCVQAGDQYLDPCQWDVSATGVVLASGQAAAGLKIALAPASVLNVQVQDAQKVLSQKIKDGRRPELTLGVWGPRGLYYPARLAGSPPAAGGLPGGIATYSYQLAVPRDTALRLYIASRDLKLGDSNGVALSANASRQTFQYATGDAIPKSFTFSVLGLLP